MVRHFSVVLALVFGLAFASACSDDDGPTPDKGVDQSTGDTSVDKGPTPDQGPKPDNDMGASAYAARCTGRMTPPVMGCDSANPICRGAPGVDFGWCTRECSGDGDCTADAPAGTDAQCKTDPFGGKKSCAFVCAGSVSNPPFANCPPGMKDQCNATPVGNLCQYKN